MKVSKTVWGIALSLAFVGVTGASADEQQQQRLPSRPTEEVVGTVTKVSDGDTIHVVPRGKTEAEKLKIRMVGMDTPELHLPVSGGVANQGHWAEDASRALARMLPLNTVVTLQSYGQDVHGRTLARVFKGESDVNLHMVEIGWGAAYVICSGPGCKSGFFASQGVHQVFKACERAVRAGRGIFDPADPLKELPFEFRLRMGERKPDKYVGDVETKKLFAPEDYDRVPLCRRVFFTRVADATRMGFKR